MRFFQKIGDYILENVFGNLLEDYFSDKLEVIGIAVSIASIISVIAVFAISKAILGIVQSTYEPVDKLLQLDVSNDQIMHEAYDDFDLVLCLSAQRGQSLADSFVEFRKNLIRFQTSQKSIWERLDPDDERSMHLMYCNEETVNRIAKILKLAPAGSLDEFKKHVRMAIKANHSS